MVSARTPSHPSGSRLFAPLFAVRYDADESLARAGQWLNAAHPLTRWLLAHADILATEFQAPFHRVFLRATTLTDVDEINSALDRIARGRPDIAPPPTAYLREDENGWWCTR